MECNFKEFRSKVFFEKGHFIFFDLKILHILGVEGDAGYPGYIADKYQRRWSAFLKIAD